MLYFNEKKIIKAYTGALRCMSVRAEHEAAGGYWITDGFTAVKCQTPEDWRTIGGAIFGEAAGAWIRDNNGTFKNDNAGLSKTLCDMTAKPGELAAVAPMVYELDGKAKARVLYDAKNDIAVMVNAAYLEFFDADCVFHVTGDTKPVVVIWHDEVVGIVLPIRPKPEISAAARAYYGKAEAVKAEKEAERKAEADAITAALLDGAKQKIAELNARIAELEKQLAEKPAPVDMPAPVVRDIAAEAEAVAVKFRNINGKISATVKGANTSAPVVWIGGDVAKHEAELEAAGAVYSNKRGAWYYRVIA